MREQESKSTTPAQRNIEEFERSRKIHTAEWLESIRNAKRCEWCAFDHALNRRGLCVFCERIRKKLEKAQKEDVADLRRPSRIRLAEAEKQNSIAWGNVLKAHLHSSPRGLHVEHLLTELGGRMTGEILFHGDSHEIDWTFDATQRAILAYLLWTILSRQAQKCRRQFAAKDLLDAAMRQARGRS
jgi:hypothetical protein